MREILFRGKAVNLNNGSKDFVYGQYVQNRDGKMIYSDTWENGIQKHYVIEGTVGQYTGLTDKNGNKIFEGDIVKEEYEVFVSARKREKRTRIGYVEYSDCDLCNGYYAYFWNDKEKWQGNFGIHHCCKVIGNIYDNPELLKGGGE